MNRNFAVAGVIASIPASGCGVSLAMVVALLAALLMPIPSADAAPPANDSAASERVGARVYWVAPDGSDSNSGSREAPWRTIGKAAETVVAGETVIIRGGIYRETLNPANSGAPGKPITFKAAAGADVVISGCERIEDWSVSGTAGVFRAKMEGSLGKNNQLFFDGKPLQSARWPNDSDQNFMTPDGAAIDGGSAASLISSALPDDIAEADILGAVLWVHAGRGWSSWTSTVAGYDSATKTITFPSFTGNWWVEQRHNPASGRGTFYLSGTIGLLDAPGEWFYDPSSQAVFLRPPADADPNANIVEARARQTGIDLRNRAWVVVDGMELFACTADLENARHCTVRGVKATYIHHTSGGNTAASLGEKSGIHITGNNNTIRASEIAHSAGNGVYLAGHSNAVVNCWIHDIGYLGSYCSPVRVRGMRNMLSHSTVSDAGRDCIHMNGAEHLIQYNSISRPGRICRDLGNIYIGGNDGGNTQIRYNWVFENPGHRGTNLGIYLDNYTKNYLIHHNAVWDVPVGIRLNRPSGFVMVLNNTVSSEINNNWGPWKGPRVQWGSHLINNLTRDGIKMNPEVSMLANQAVGAEIESWLGEDGPRLDVQRGAEWAGVFVPGYNLDRKPRIGAIHSKKSRHRPGHDFSNAPHPICELPDTPLRNHIGNAAFEYNRYYEDAGLPEEDLPHWETIGAGEATVEYFPGFNSPPANERNSVHGNSLKLSGDNSGAKQRVDGLQPNTTYYLSCYARQGPDTTVKLSITGAGDTTVVDSEDGIRAGNSPWVLLMIKYRTRANEDTVKIGLSKQGPDDAYVDDVGLIPATWMQSDILKEREKE